MFLMKTIRIANGGGFWGDWLEAPLNQVRLGKINYLTIDYLAELTMSILARQYQATPSLGYAGDFVKLMEELLPELQQKQVKVIVNAGGVNPQGCAQAVKKVAEKLNLNMIKIAAVSGDNIKADLNTLLAAGEQLQNLDNQQDFKSVKDKIVSANAYLGAGPIVEALKNGADIIITGRVADAALALAPMIYEFNWDLKDYDKLALGIVAGHVIECGAQASGGNCSDNWQEIPDLANIGYPIIEISENLDCAIIKHGGTGGAINIATVSEQLVYEIDDPKNYMTPDVIADFTSIKLEQAGNNRVSIRSVKGKTPTDMYKVSVAYENGFKVEGTLFFAPPQAKAKAQASANIINQRVAKLNLEITESLTEFIGYNSCSPERNPPDSGEVLLRMAVHGPNAKDLQRWSREMVPLVLSGPPGVSGYAGARPKPQEIFSYWPALISKKHIKVKIDYY